MLRNPLEPFRTFSRRIGQWIPKGPPGLTVLSVDGRWLKLLHVRGRPAARTITTLMAHPIDGMSEEDVLQWLQQACAAKGFEPGTVLIANPSHLTTTRLFTLPSTDPREIRDIVELQAEKHTPYAKEEILTDFQIIETDRTGYSRVLLILSHQDIVHRGLKLVAGMGWPLERVGFEFEGLVNWFRVVQDGSPQGTVLVAEVDSEATSLAILHQGKPYFHRSLAVGVSQLTSDPEEGPAKLIAEFQRSLETFEGEGLALAVSSVVLTGQAGRFPELKDRVQRGLDLPTTVVAPFEGCSLAENAMTQEDMLSRVSFSSLVGLALKASTIDLTPKALKLHRAFEVRARRLVGLGCQLVGVLLLVSCLLIGEVLKSERDHAWLLREHQALAAEAQTIESLLGQLEFVQDWLDGRGQLLEAVVDLGRRTPPAIQWDSLTFTKEGGLTLKGVSEQIPKVYDFTRELKKSPLFAQVEVRRATKRRVDNQDVTEFEITCSLASPGPLSDQDTEQPEQDNEG